eukprot:TRINITY_DN1698_c0_g1_i2.p3 TRINITY_DN1698_c0_g1~~TRINITY_DN1698_c0_g1_i2.p3  ORF type:complete len:164 (-),score=41.21 TRINITY_DN1698_c0_g1_i2:631-1122(-)
MNQRPGEQPFRTTLSSHIFSDAGAGGGGSSTPFSSQKPSSGIVGSLPSETHARSAYGFSREEFPRAKQQEKLSPTPSPSPKAYLPFESSRSQAEPPSQSLYDDSQPIFSPLYNLNMEGGKRSSTGYPETSLPPFSPLSSFSSSPLSQGGRGYGSSSTTDLYEE